MASIPAHQPSKSGQLSGKYYRTRSLSQNLQQIFHPHRQSHSRSINNLSAVGAAGGVVRTPTANVLKVPQSLPQSPRILIEAASPFFPPLQIPSLNFSPPCQAQNQVLPMFQFAQPTTKISEPSKFKGFNLGDYRKNKFTRGTSVDIPSHPKPLEKRLSWEQRRSPPQGYRNDRFQINDVLKENKELLRKYSDPKITLQIREPGSLQKAFKAKLASLFRNKKKYTIAEPSFGKENFESYSIHRCDSCQSLPTLMTRKNVKQSKNEKKEKKLLRKMKKTSLDRYRAHDKLKSLNLNPPHMIGGSFDNLLLINRLNQKKTMMGTYDTYHGRPLISQSSRLRALYKYRKPSESDDATTLSFDYDSGDISDNSSLEQSSSDAEQDSSSYSDLTTKSSNYGYKMRSSTSVHSMPHIKVSNKTKKSVTAAQSPNRSLETSQFSFKSMDGNRAANQSNAFIPQKPAPFHLTHQMSAPLLSMTSMIHQPQQLSYAQPAYRNNYYPSLSMPGNASNQNQNPNQTLKAFFTSGPASSNDFPLVRFSLTKMKDKKMVIERFLHPHKSLS